MTKPYTDYDSPWKEILEQFFPAFMEFFFPTAYRDIDWRKPHEFLDKELQKVVRKAATGRHTVDKLVKVWRKDGLEAWVLVHIEVQSQVDPHFDRRMYVMNYRLFDRYAQQVISLAVLSDDDATWRPQEYGYHLWGCEVGIRFPTVKLLDYAPQWAMLEQSTNPFAVVIMAHLQAQSTRRYPRNRLRSKIELVKALYARGYTRKQIGELFRFIDWVLALPEKYELQFEQAVKGLEEADRMRYVTSIERRAIQRGLEQGIEQGIVQGTRDNLFDILRLRFTILPEELSEQINQMADLTQLKVLLQAAVRVATLEDFERLLAIEKP